jgi:hypothetical protein
MWKQYNKLRDHSTTNMDDEELTSHHEAVRLIKKISNLQLKKCVRGPGRWWQVDDDML